MEKLQKTELKKEELAKLYRQFSRQKYNKYRHQFPRMRESELISKIIKEWQSMDSKTKEHLYNQYKSNKFIKDDKSQSSGKKSPGSSKQKKNGSTNNKKEKDKQFQTPQKKKGAIRVFISQSSKKQIQSQQSDFVRNRVRQDFQISESDSKQLGTQPKNKKITKQTKQPRTQYLKFFKFYYNKLIKEHPRWMAHQISTIIKLLWKKKNCQDKAPNKVIKEPKQMKIISGRMIFRRTHGYTGIEAAQRWKQLPLESKKYWKSKGFGLKSGERKIIIPLIAGQMIKRKGDKTSTDIKLNKTLQFLNNNIV